VYVRLVHHLYAFNKKMTPEGDTITGASQSHAQILSRSNPIKNRVVVART
jgi:hypothetical protein